MPQCEEKVEHVKAFIEQLRLSKGKWAGEPFRLIPWEVDLIEKIFGTLREDGTRQYHTVYVEIPKKSGKALAIDTPIPTPDGWTTMGVLKPGDKVFDERGKACSVVACTEIMHDRPCYEVYFSDGGSIVADGEHLWQVKEYKPHTAPYYETKILKTEEMKENVKHRSGCYSYRIPPRPAFDLEGKKRLFLPREDSMNPTKNSFRTITAIHEVPSVPVKCIQVDSPSSLYLAGKSMVPTHNSELCAAIALYMLLADGEANAEVYSAACDRQQASIVFNTAVQFIENNPTLRKVTKIIKSTKRIVYERTGSFYQVLSSDVKSKSGLNISCAIIDEIWTFPTPDLTRMLTTGSGDARTQPLFMIITTAGNKLSGIGWDYHCKAKDILEGKRVDPTFLPIIYGLGEGDDWEDEKNWHMANPSLGHTIQIERVREAYQQAKQDAAEEALFKQLRLNMWLKQKIKWMPMDVWDAGAEPVNPDKLRGRICYGGLDLSSTTDLSAFVLVFPPIEGDDSYYVLPYFWLPEETLELRVRRDHVPYDQWEQEGKLQTTEGNVIHYGFIETFIEELGQQYNIKEIAFDRWGAVQMSQNLDGLGFTVVPFGQGFKDMSPPTKELMKLSLEKKIQHGGHPVLRWMMDNVHVKLDPAGNIKPDKEKSTERIDGAVALVMALDRAIRNEGSHDSVYERRGILVL